LSWQAGSTIDLYGVTYGNGTFVTVGRSDTIITSSDATTWTSRDSSTGYHLTGVIFIE